MQEEVIGKHVLLVGVFSMQSYLAFALSLVTQVLWFKCETWSMSKTSRALKPLGVEG